MKHKASVTFEKIVENGKPVFKYISSSGVLFKDGLPVKYIEGHSWFARTEYGIQSSFMNVIRGTILTPAEYKRFTEYLTVCGEYLITVLLSEIHHGTITYKV